MAQATAMMAGSEVIKSWPDDQRQTTQTMIDQYGEPDEVTPDRLLWLNRGRWREIIASREGIPHDFPFPHLDIVENVTDYRVPPGKCSELAEFDGSVTVRRTAGTISARCHDEQANLLAINLSNDIINGEQTVEGARKAYVAAMVEWRGKGSSAYMDELQFEPQTKTNDPDVAVTTPGELTRISATIGGQGSETE